MRKTPLLLVFVLVLSACQMRFDTSVVINEDGSGSFAIEIGLDEDFREFSEGGDMTEGFEGLDGFGWTIEEFVDGEFEGVRVSTAFESLAALNASLAQLEGLEGTDDGPAPDMFANMSIIEDGGTFTFTAGSDALDDSLLSDGSDDLGIDPATLLEEVFIIRLLVTLPGEPLEHNADEVDGSTFIWNIGIDDGGSVFMASSSVGGGSGTLIIVILTVVIAGFLLMRLAGSNDEESAEAEETA